MERRGKIPQCLIRFEETCRTHLRGLERNGVIRGNHEVIKGPDTDRGSAWGEDRSLHWT